VGDTFGQALPGSRGRNGRYQLLNIQWFREVLVHLGLHRLNCGLKIGYPVKMKVHASGCTRRMALTTVKPSPGWQR